MSFETRTRLTYRFESAEPECGVTEDRSPRLSGETPRSKNGREARGEESASEEDGKTEDAEEQRNGRREGRKRDREREEDTACLIVSTNRTEMNFRLPAVRDE